MQRNAEGHGLIISPEEEKRIKDIFNKIDVNKDGQIDINDLTKALHQMQVPQFPGQAQRFIDQYANDKDGSIDFAEFVQYVTEHEKKLKLSFERVDHNQDGLIDAEEIMISLGKMGVHLDKNEAETLLKRMDKDETLQINWNEWREFLLLHPSADIHDIVHYWRHASIIDVGEDALVPDDFTETELQTGMWWRHLVAGGAAGAVSRTCTAPLDRLKVMLQVHGSRKGSLGIKSGFQYMLKEGGVRSMWRGNGINVIKIAPESAIKFMAYEQIKRIFKAGTQCELRMVDRFMAGSLAGAISQSIIYPMEVLKTRLALRHTGQYSGICHCAREILRNEGLTSFYRGYIPNLIGIIPYAGIDLCVYETLKRQYIKHHTAGEDPGVIVMLTCGTVSSTCGQLASYPLALVRTKLQAKVTPLHSQQETMTTLFRHILVNEGPRGLYRGICPNFMKVAPAVSISYVVYEHIRKILGVEMT